ncbi:MAG: CopG family transcriptional regulator [Armatimonadetes bacterium]|nr:CopG family transcriptional regulator [Armatimonadota bacterium]
MSVSKQNVTLSLPKSLLRKAKMVAAGKDKSLSELLREALEEKIGENSGYNTARNRQLRLLQKGFDFGTMGRLKVSREELHDRG